MAAPDYDELRRLEPRLDELEVDLRACRDDGERSFFCSNHAWLPFNARLRALIGVARPRSQDHELDRVLRDSVAYEVAYERLSPLLPPCRDCGCTLFEPVREEQLGDLDGVDRPSH